MDATRQILLDNAKRVFDSVADCCASCGRQPEDVKVIAVTKYVDTAISRLLAEVLGELVGQSHPVILGENRPQLLLEKKLDWQDGPRVEWHLIGQLQSNKIKKVVGQVEMIHSLDRIELLEKLEHHAANANLDVNVLLEINISGDANKHGLVEADFESIVDVASGPERIRLCGLMGMGGLESTPEQTKRQFQNLALSLLLIGQRLPENDRSRFSQLSMGMSDDMALAIEAGSTMVRIGSAFFKGLR